MYQLHSQSNAACKNKGQHYCDTNFCIARTERCKRIVLAMQKFAGRGPNTIWGGLKASGDYLAGDEGQAQRGHHCSDHPQAQMI